MWTQAACTRDRPTPEAVVLPTPELPAAESADEDAQQPAVVPAVEAEGEQSDSAVAVPAPEQPQVEQPPQPTATAVPQSRPETETIQYTVLSGDSIESIADKFGVTPQEIRDLNHLQSDYLQANQLLIVPLLEGYTPLGKPTPTPEPYIHVVRPGETLYGIAAFYGIDAISLIAANNIVDRDGLVIGQQLVIPEYAPEAGAAGLEPQTGPGVDSSGVPGQGGGFQVVHIVKPGEGLYAIAAQYGVSADAIASANNIQNYELLRVGQRLYVPGVQLDVFPSAANQQVHIVQPGEGLLQIAVIYGVSAQAIAELNNLTDSDLIYPGQQLLIPGQ